MTKPAQDEPVRVELTCGGHQVIVQAPGSLRTVAAKALELFRSIADPDVVRGFGTTVGFSATDPVTYTPADLTLPSRMTDMEARPCALP